MDRLDGRTSRKSSVWTIRQGLSQRKTFIFALLCFTILSFFGYRILLSRPDGMFTVGKQSIHILVNTDSNTDTLEREKQSKGDEPNETHKGKIGRQS